MIDVSLRTHAGEALAEGRLAHPIHAVRLFGFHLATLDLRQNSDMHEAVVAELLSHARVADDYPGLHETGRVNVLLQEWQNPRPLRRTRRGVFDTTQSELAIFRAAASINARYGAETLPHAIISKAQSVSDLLEVALLLKESGSLRATAQGPVPALRIVPLFETITDLQQCIGVMKTALRCRSTGAGSTHRTACRKSCLILFGQQQGWRVPDRQLGALLRANRVGETGC